MTQSNPRENKCGRWSDTEHGLFVKYLRVYGKNWRGIANHVKTRSAVQVRTHAQKYFLKLEHAFNKNNRYLSDEEIEVLERFVLAEDSSKPKGSQYGKRKSLDCLQAQNCFHGAMLDNLVLPGSQSGIPYNELCCKKPRYELDEPIKMQPNELEQAEIASCETDSLCEPGLWNDEMRFESIDAGYNISDKLNLPVREKFDIYGNEKPFSSCSCRELDPFLDEALLQIICSED